MRHRLVTIGVMPLIALLVFTGCATFGPPGPTMPALIGAGKTQAQFAMDDANCRQLATARAGDPAQVQQSQAVSTILGGLLGAAAGAAIGGATGGGRAAGIGAAIGGTAGTGIGLARVAHKRKATRRESNSAGMANTYNACMRRVIRCPA